MPNNHGTSSPTLGGKWAVILFIFTLLAFVVESQLTQYVQTTLHYRQPFFIFYVVHSTFAVIFPIHLLYLLVTTGYSTRTILKGLSFAIKEHLSPLDTSRSFPRRKFLILILSLTVGITCPSLLWFASITLASISDVTAIWNTNAFFAYLFTVKIFKLKWESRKLIAVSLATLGTIVVLYGGSTSQVDKSISVDKRALSMIPRAPLIGDLLTLMASVGYGLYQVLYKKYAALPSDPELASERHYVPIPIQEGTSSETSFESSELADAYPPPFGFHPNMLTSAMGLCTFIVLWVPIPIFHYLGIEPFLLPTDAITYLSIAGIALSGVVFNAGFMILLGVWGPIITSVGNLLTIVLVLFSDILLGRGAVLTIWSLAGSGVIVAAFGILAYDMFNARQ